MRIKAWGPWASAESNHGAAKQPSSYQGALDEFSEKGRRIREDRQREFIGIRDASIKVALDELENGRDAHTVAVKKEHVADVAGYLFDCRRHGDFLTIFVTRGDQKFSTSVNLVLVKEIRVANGTVAGALSKLTWHYTQHGDNGFSISDFPTVLPDTHGRAHTWSTKEPWRTCYCEPPKREIDPFESINSEGWPFGEYPGWARDDKVIFVGVGSSIMAPFGMGQPVHDRIMAEMASQPTIEE